MTNSQNQRSEATILREEFRWHLSEARRYLNQQRDEEGHPAWKSALDHLTAAQTISASLYRLEERMAK
jgi:hypothetical protein